ncbi:glutathione S-transferase omega-2-like [Bacillus rossius redtenbacheri]|uniref:glutathione S-transferase omega-2-like n=1 Tax=Bacillus rossius redtenbacheri TaxID=93214 RepID=UPI002FDEE65A
MSGAFYSAGSTEPPKVPGKYCLYGLKYSANTQQVRLVLLTKNVPHELVNVNPKSIPDWYKKIQPDGQFPAFDTGNQVLVGISDIIAYIDEKFPQPSLFPAGKDRKAVIAEIEQQLLPVAKDTKVMFDKKGARTSQETHEVIKKLTERLESTGKPFLSGDTAGIGDFMVWPWIQMAQLSFKAHGGSADQGLQKVPKVAAWDKAMRSVKAVQEVIVPEDEFLNLLK